MAWTRQKPLEHFKSLPVGSQLMRPATCENNFSSYIAKGDVVEVKKNNTSNGFMKVRSFRLDDYLEYSEDSETITNFFATMVCKRHFV